MSTTYACILWTIFSSVADSPVIGVKLRYITHAGRRSDIFCLPCDCKIPPWSGAPLDDHGSRSFHTRLQVLLLVSSVPVRPCGFETLLRLYRPLHGTIREHHQGDHPREHLPFPAAAAASVARYSCALWCRCALEGAGAQVDRTSVSLISPATGVAMV